MRTSAALGRFELRRARDVENGARRIRVNSAGEGLQWLRRLRIDAGFARALIRAASAPHDVRDPLHALALLLWRGAYTLLEHPPTFRAPAVEEGRDEPTDHGEREAEQEESETDGKPPAIVPYEYPYLATRLTNAKMDAVGEAKIRLDAELFKGLLGMPGEVIPQVYRDASKVARGGVKESTNEIIEEIEKHWHTFDAPEPPPDQVPKSYRHIASEKIGSMKQVTDEAAASLTALHFDVNEALDNHLTSEALPSSYRDIGKEKTRGVHGAVQETLARLDQLKYPTE